MTHLIKGRSLCETLRDYTAIDTETTGLSPQWNELIELAAVRVRNGVETARFETLVKPRVRIDGFITGLTGITNAMVKEAPFVSEALPPFLDFIGNDILVGHNVNFDVEFILTAANRQSLSFSNDFLCTMKLSKRLYPWEENHTLGRLVDRFEIHAPVAHRALADALVTASCYEKMLEEASLCGIRLLSVTRAKEIQPARSDFDESSPVYGRVFAFAGKMKRLGKIEMMTLVVDAGGRVSDGLPKKASYLVLSNDLHRLAARGRYVNKAVETAKSRIKDGADLKIVSENDLFEMLSFDIGALAGARV